MVNSFLILKNVYIYRNTVTSNSNECSLIDCAITELNIKTNNLLSKLSFNESTTLSRLFSSYCKNVYGSPYGGII